MPLERPPDVVREKTDDLGGGRVCCAVILDRELSRGEIARFYLVDSVERPAAMDFDVAGRVIAWECRKDDEPRWRLALEILLVKSFRQDGAGKMVAPTGLEPVPRP